MPGRSVITKWELCEAVSAAALDQRTLTVPDFAEIADLAADPASTAALIERRVLNACTPGFADTYRWPKDDGSSRLMSNLDPLDSILYRALAGRFVRQMEARLGPHVLAGRRVRARPYWRLGRYTTAVRQRAAMAAEWLDDSKVAAMITLDIENFFYDIQATPLALSLSRVPGPGVSKAFLLSWLSDLERNSGAPGLPVGFDASRVLANHLLTRSDQVLDDFGQWLRFWDDTWVFPGAMIEPASIASRYGSAVARERLSLNGSKYHAYDKDEAREIVRSSVIDYFSYEDENGKQRIDVEEAAGLFDLGCSDPTTFKRELRRGLTVLTKHDLLNCRAIEAFRSDPDLLQMAPDHWGRYFEGLARTKEGRKRLDLDWVAQSVVAPASRQPDAERLVLLPALATGQPSKEVGQALYALGADLHAPDAIRQRAIEAWGRAKGWKRSGAVELALGGDTYTIRRAALATLRGKPGDERSVRQAVRSASASDPELAPTCDWVLADM